MSDGQLTMILAAIATLGGSLITALRWAVNRVTKSNDDGTAALIANTASNAVLVVKLDNLASKIDDVSDFVERHTPVHGVPISASTGYSDEGRPGPKFPRAPTPLPGTYHQGPKKR